MTDKLRKRGGKGGDQRKREEGRKERERGRKDIKEGTKVLDGAKSFTDYDDEHSGKCSLGSRHTLGDVDQTPS